MPKERKISNNLGRDEEIDPNELVRRYAALRRALEDNWGRIGRDLPRIREPHDLLPILNRVKGVNWLPAFRDFPMGCLLRSSCVETTWREVRETRTKYEEAEKLQGQLSLESHSAHQAAQSAKNAFDVAEAEFDQQQATKQNQRRLAHIKEQLRVEELTKHAQELATSFQEAQLKRKSLEDLLGPQESWLARSEVVGFVRDPKQRYRKTADNFAKAMAGLPHYDWLYSIRKCNLIPQTKTVRSSYLFQIFQLLRSIVKQTRSANMAMIELRLKKELLKPDTDPSLLSYISPQWFYFTLAFEDWRGKKLRSAVIPYKILATFLDHLEGPSTAEFELAKHNRLIP